MIASWTAALEVLAYAAVMGVSVVLGGMFCGMETGVYVLNKVRLDLRAEKGRTDARRLKRLLASPHNLLATILIGTNVTGYITTFCATAIFVAVGAGDSAEWFTILLTTPILFVFAESVPKSVFRRLSERVTYRRAWFLAAASRVFNTLGISPLVRGFSAALASLVPKSRRQTPLGSSGLATVLAESHAVGLLTTAQATMADRVMRISGVHVGEAMIPMKDVVTAPVDISRQDLTVLFRAHNVSRVPVVDPAGRVVGILDLYQALIDPDGDPPGRRMAGALRFERSMRINEALYRMQHASAVMAVVVDSAAADAPAVGIVTLKDLVEQIVGELRAW